MAGLIPQTFIDDLLERIDIVDVVDPRVKLKKNGKNYSACCPFHEEKTPSFTVSPDKQFFYCFGCGASGSALSFILEFDRVSFPEAVDTLARMAGVEVPREARENSPQQDYRKHLYRILEQADEHFRQQLRQSPARQHAVNYLQSRGLSGEIARDFAIGYAPPGWDNLLKTLGNDDQRIKQLNDAGLLIERPEDQRRYDRFRNRIMFPIRDSRGRVIGFGGRVLSPDDKPKYLNSPETPVFHKGKELYGLFEARKHYRELPQLLVVEGYMDVVALAQFGIHYAVATLGTACGEDHLTLAFKHTQEVVFCFDGDNAGRKAARRALENCLSSMRDGRQVKFLFLPDGEDPDSLVRQVGAEKFSRMVDLAVPLEDFLFDAMADGIDIRSMEGRARFSKKAAPLLHRLPSGVFKELMFASLAKRTGLTLNTLMELIEPEPTPKAPPAHAEQKPRTPPSTTTNTPVPQREAKQHLDPPAYASESYAFSDYDNHYPELTPQSTEPDHYASAIAPNNTAQQHQSPTASAVHKPITVHSGAIKLPPSKLLCAMLLQHPELALATPESLPNLEDSNNDGDLKTFFELLSLLRQRQGYSLHRILGHWRGTRGEQATLDLAELAGIELINVARLGGSYNAKQEYLDTLTMLEHRYGRQKQSAELAQFNRKNFNDLSEAEKEKIRNFYATQGKKRPPDH